MFKAVYLDENKNQGTIDGLDREKLKALLDNSKASVWIDIQDPEDAEIDFLLETMHFHQLTVEDCLIPQQHAKIAFFDDYIFLTIHSFVSSVKEFEISLTSEETDVFLGRNFIVTVHEYPVKIINELLAGDNSKAQNAGLTKGIDYAVYTLLDRIIDSYFPVIENYNTLFDILDDKIFKDSNPILMGKILKAKKSLLTVRKYLGPLRAVMSQLIRTNTIFVKAKSLVYYRDVYDHVMLLYDMVENFRDMFNTIMEAHLANTSNRLNEIMKTLTVVATIMMPLTLITSFYGMNVKAPEFEWGLAGYIFVWVILLLTLVFMLIFFKRRRLL
ncbi:MAG: magnesium/cobalt transporter CorA [bacterium]|nr:magnesium/cobalt transporter CorA [bacterium]MDD5354886.1 magnesium/cobalt transporter CorA [bacterium]